MTKNPAENEEDAGKMLTHLSVLAEKHNPLLAVLLLVLADIPTDCAAIYSLRLTGMLGLEETSRQEADIIRAAVAVLRTPEYWYGDQKAR